MLSAQCDLVIFIEFHSYLQVASTSSAPRRICIRNVIIFLQFITDYLLKPIPILLRFKLFKLAEICFGLCSTLITSEVISLVRIKLFFEWIYSKSYGFISFPQKFTSSIYFLHPLLLSEQWWRGDPSPAVSVWETSLRRQR